jgi:p-hydroxybenzoate 3-monooxygenase
MRTQVGIVGAGPAGLTLAQLLRAEGVESVVLEARSRDHVERRIRAGVLEQGTVDTLVGAGAGERLAREGIVHHGIGLQFGGERHRVPLSDLTGGAAIVIYGQTEIVKDLIELRLDAGEPLSFEVEDVALHDIETDRPQITYVHEGRAHELECDIVAGCDGFHGVCREAIPADVLTEFSREYPYGWLGILARAAPAHDEVVYCNTERGFALLSLRSPEISRLYLQCRPDEDLDDWPDERIWEELDARVGVPGTSLNRGPIAEKGVTGMRSYVAEPMRHGRLFLAGDAAHIVPPTGAKGLNLAISDVTLLAEAVAEWHRSGRTTLLDGYSDACLRRVWRAQHFSWWMTSMLHRPPGADPFDLELQQSQLRYVVQSEAQARALAENYVGLAGAAALTAPAARTRS